MSPRLPLSRRTFLVTGLAAGAAVGVGGAAAARPETATGTAASPDPFTLGVASGDPSPDGFVLWTRLAVEPLAADGSGGMPSRPVPVAWQVATNPRFGDRDVVRAGAAVAVPEWGHSVHVEVAGLAPGREYWYRFRSGSHLSPVGRTRTAPAPHQLASLTMAFTSCARFDHGHFTAYQAIADDQPDLVLHLGDYIYEYATAANAVPGREVAGPETRTLAGYRQRFAQYHAEADLQAAHAAAPWVVVWDDHEIENNWADEVPEAPDPDFLARREAATRAYYENMPLRRTSVPRGIDMQLYRRVHWGQLATFHVLDTRQYRSDQSCGDGYKDCPDRFDPARSLTGAEQEAWLLDGFRRSEARWDILGQQVFFGQRDNNAGPSTVVSQDAWDGYAASRDRITRGWLDAGVRNPVVLTGDVHAHWGSDLKLDWADPTSATVGSELVCSSITSGFDGTDSNPADHPFLKINPHLRFYNNQRGYVRTRVTPDRIDADFQVTPRVSVPGDPVYTRASFAIADREPGLHQTYDRPPTTTAAPEDLRRDTLREEGRQD